MAEGIVSILRLGYKKTAVSLWASHSILFSVSLMLSRSFASLTGVKAHCHLVSRHWRDLCGEALELSIQSQLRTDAYQNHESVFGNGFFHSSDP